MKERIISDIPVLTHTSLDAFAEVSHLVTTRAGGESPPPFDSLNVGRKVGDDPEAVRRNRDRLAGLVSCRPEDMVFAGQIHSRNVARVGDGDRGRTIGETDALITDRSDTPLAILIADCAVVALYDPRRRVVAIAHAGWRGTLAGIVVAVVDELVRAFDCNPADLIAGVGPSIGPCCYVVGPEVTDAFRNAHPALARDILFARRGAGAGDEPARETLDLKAANALMLVSAGVSPDRVTVSDHCTACHTRMFYSHRAEKGRTGRFAGVIVLHERTRRAY